MAAGNPATGYIWSAAIGCVIGFGTFVAISALSPKFTEWFGTRYELTADRLTEPNVIFDHETELLTYRATSFGIQPESDIQGAIRSEQDQILDVFEREAARDRREMRRSFKPWSVDIYYSLTAKAGPLSSVLRTEYANMGSGGNSLSFNSSFINERVEGDFSLPDLFANDEDSLEGLRRILCRTVVSAKVARTGEPNRNGEPIVCDGEDANFVIGSTPVVFAPSDIPERIGGLVFYYPPGEIGDFAEGEYIITLPQSRLVPLMDLNYAGLFAGEPGPVG